MSGPDGSGSLSVTLCAVPVSPTVGLNQTQRTVSPGSSWTVAVRVAWSTVLGVGLAPSSQERRTNCPSEPTTGAPSLSVYVPGGLEGQASPTCWPEETVKTRGGPPLQSSLILLL